MPDDARWSRESAEGERPAEREYPGGVVRWYITGGVIALVFVIYSLVDVMVTDERRIRTLNRVLWVVLIAVLPVLGGIAWFLWGKGPRSMARTIAPDDDPAFSGSVPKRDADTDERIQRLEAELAALDDEDFNARFEQLTDAQPEPEPDEVAADEPAADEPRDDDSDDSADSASGAHHPRKPGE